MKAIIIGQATRSDKLQTQAEVLYELKCEGRHVC